jgi:hypothetical protein
MLEFKLEAGFRDVAKFALLLKPNSKNYMAQDFPSPAKALGSVEKSSLAMAMLNKSAQPRVFVHFCQALRDGERNSAHQDGRQ